MLINQLYALMVCTTRKKSGMDGDDGSYCYTIGYTDIIPLEQHHLPSPGPAPSPATPLVVGQRALIVETQQPGPRVAESLQNCLGVDQPGI
jgi:hypothetical protein